jgi:hypothetical protein
MKGLLRLLLAVLAMSAYPLAHAAATFSASGANPAAIQATVDAFRTPLGTLNPNVIGSFGTGRREINWDGVPDALSAPNNVPANFFNVNSPRGVIFGTLGTGFEVSASAASGSRWSSATSIRRTPTCSRRSVHSGFSARWEATSST